VGKPYKNISLGRQRDRWENNFKMNLNKVGWGEWTGLLWQVAGTCECGNEPSDSTKCREFLH